MSPLRFFWFDVARLGKGPNLTRRALSVYPRRLVASAGTARGVYNSSGLLSIPLFYRDLSRQRTLISCPEIGVRAWGDAGPFRKSCKRKVRDCLLRQSLKRHEDRLRKAQQALSRKAKFGNNWKKAKARVRRIHARFGNARGDYLRKTSTTTDKNHAMVWSEDLRVRNMSKSAAGTADAPGRNVRAKSGLNKFILDQARFVCVECGFEDNADVVGALDVLRAGHARFACEASGAVIPPAAGTHRSDSGTAQCRA